LDGGVGGTGELLWRVSPLDQDAVDGMWMLGYLFLLADEEAVEVLEDLLATLRLLSDGQLSLRSPSSSVTS
jgi:hypothetical protein